jgi:hypothetical protein
VNSINEHISYLKATAKPDQVISMQAVFDELFELRRAVDAKAERYISGGIDVATNRIEIPITGWAGGEAVAWPRDWRASIEFVRDVVDTERECRDPQGTERARYTRAFNLLSTILATITPAAQVQQEAAGPAYGIVDPDYARIFTIARCLAWSEGYALAMHGSFTRDLDLIATPWTDSACAPEHLAARIAEAAGLRERKDNPGTKSHGRLVWTLHLPGFGEPRWVDLSIMPRESTHPSACELGAVREVIDRRKAEAENRSRADDGYMMGWSDGVAGFARELEAAIQHRGDSQEVGRG